MEKFSLHDSDTWSIIKWIFGAMSFVVLSLSRWFFGDIRDTLKEHGRKFEEIKNEAIKTDTLIGELKKDIEKVRNHYHGESEKVDGVYLRLLEIADKMERGLNGKKGI